MKKVSFNLLLAAMIVALAFICYRSIMDPIEFAEERSVREKAIIARLIDIKTAQIEYRNAHRGEYTDNFDTLIDFVKNAQLPIIMKIGDLNDAQLERGLTDRNVVEAVEKALKSNKWVQKIVIDPENRKTIEVDLEKEGLKDFRRDTTWVALIDTIYKKSFVADSLRFVPFSNNVTFEMRTRCDTTKSGTAQWLFEACTPYETYLAGINDQEMHNLISTQKKLGRYCGLKVGNVEQPNNNAGNWE